MQGLRAAGTRFFWRLYASYSAVLLITALITYFLVVRNQDEALVRGLEASLKNATYFAEPLVFDAFEAGPTSGLQEELRRLERETGYRTTLIDVEGRVLGDSDEDPVRMDNHGSRPEVLAAYAQGVGVAQRFSRTVGYDMLYVARSLRADAEGGEEGEVVGVLRVAVPLTEVEARIARARDVVILGAGVGLLVALGLGLLVAKRTTAPIAEIKRVAEELRAGHYESRVRDLPDDEIGLLGDTLNRLAGEVAQRLSSMAAEDARLRAMLAGMVEGVAAVDGDDRIVFLNRAARELLQIGDEEVVRRPLWEVVRVRELEKLLAGARASGAVERCEVDVGGARTLEAHASPISVRGAEAGSARGLVVVFHDITDLRRLERVRRDFVANVSHELKTPLTAIKGFVETLASGAMEEPEVRVRFLERIDDNVDRLSHLVTDLLSLARIEGQGEALGCEPVDLGEIVTEVAQRAQANAERKGVNLSVETGHDPVVVGDAEALRQIVNNLLENAINYTPAPGAVKVGVARDGELVTLEVSDTGVGIPAKDLQRIFERFYRVDKARSRELGGTGLGLSIVRNLVQAMKGTVKVESEVGEGSRFVVSLPALPRVE